MSMINQNIETTTMMMVAVLEFEKKQKLSLIKREPEIINNIISID